MVMVFLFLFFSLLIFMNCSKKLFIYLRLRWEVCDHFPVCNAMFTSYEMDILLFISKIDLFEISERWVSQINYYSEGRNT